MSGRRTCSWIVVLGLSACVRQNEGPAHEGPSSFRIEVVDGSVGAADNRLPFSLDGAPLTIAIEAVQEGGLRDDSFAGYVRLAAEPGDVIILSGPEGIVSGNVPLADGRSGNVQILVARSYGDTYLWAEDVGFAPAPPGGEAGCANRRDDDGDGLYDFPGDPGCYFANDDSEQSGNFGTGISETLFFANPRLADVQGRASATPLSGAAVTVDVGEPDEPDLIVTRLAVDGLYLSDLTALDDYGHVFAFNFSTPERTRICDRISRIDGIVSEFYGFTELNFPSWRVIPWDGEPGDGTCDVPEPIVVGAQRVASDSDMEALEAGLIRVQDVLVGSFVNCDLNADGSVNFPDGSACDEECTCAKDCEDDPHCTEESQFLEYGQWTVSLEGGDGPKLYVLSASTVPEVDPREHGAERFASITGTLRHLQFIDPPWILEPRCPDDLVSDGGPVPVDEACVTSRTEDPDDVF